MTLFFGTHALYKMPELLYRAIHEKKTVVDIDSSDGAIAEDIPIMRDDDKKSMGICNVRLQQFLLILYSTVCTRT